MRKSAGRSGPDSDVPRRGTTAPVLIPPGLRSVHTAGPGGHSASVQHSAQKKQSPGTQCLFGLGHVHFTFGSKAGPSHIPTFNHVLPRTLKLSSGRRPATRPPPMVLRPGSAPLARPQSDFVTSDRVLTQPGRSPHPLRWALWGDGPPKCPSRRPPGRQRS